MADDEWCDELDVVEPSESDIYSRPRSSCFRFFETDFRLAVDSSIRGFDDDDDDDPTNGTTGEIGAMTTADGGGGVVGGGGGGGGGDVVVVVVVLVLLLIVIDVVVGSRIEVVVVGSSEPRPMPIFIDDRSILVLLTLAPPTDESFRSDGISFYKFKSKILTTTKIF